MDLFWGKNLRRVKVTSSGAGRTKGWGITVLVHRLGIGPIASRLFVLAACPFWLLGVSEGSVLASSFFSSTHP